jgi:tRNA dimethylallyltransferase
MTDTLLPAGATAFLVEHAWFLTGPTASGKTAVGLELAERIGAEIVSLDSMAVYRGMDIGTAKPSLAERQRVPHHLIDMVDPQQTFSVAQYLTAAHAAARQIVARGRVPLFVGGTPLYLKGLLRGLFAGPPADEALRQRWAAWALAAGPGALHARLADVDPAAAARLHPQDTRRLIRALEVFDRTGVPISRWQQQFDRAGPGRVFVLAWPRALLSARINDRVVQMFAVGLVDEVRRLTAGGAALGRTAGAALSYREVAEHLAGLRTEDETLHLIQTRTRQLAKRQLTWFRSLAECQEVPCQAAQTAAETAAQIVARAQPSGRPGAGPLPTGTGGAYPECPPTG